MPDLYAPLQGYDLPTSIQRALEEVDGRPPTPAFFSTEGDVPGTLTLEPDNRGPAAIVVGLSIFNTLFPAPDVLTFSLDLVVKGVTLVEGELPADALVPQASITILASAAPVPLQAPIRLDSKTPLRLQFGMLTGEPIDAGTFRAEMQVLYGSVKAVESAMRRFGQARWWSFYGPRGLGDTVTRTLTVEIGGRPTYAQNRSRFVTPNQSAFIQLDGTAMTQPGVVQVLTGEAFLPHDVIQAQVYQYTLNTAGAPPNTGRAFWSWHGPSADYF